MAYVHYSDTADRWDSSLSSRLASRTEQIVENNGCLGMRNLGFDAQAILAISTTFEYWDRGNH